KRGPGMAEAKMADVIKWAQGQMIYKMTERIERAKVWPRQGQLSGESPKNLFDYQKDQEGPSMAMVRTAKVIEWAHGQRIYRMTKMIERAQA
ncbi:hypothetical protein EV363DRAFT_1181924, partial [Boletus edulis]